MQRIAIVGTSCSGKTTFAVRLARCLGIPHVELDALHWGPNWTESPAEEFRSRVDRATSAGQWICEGNYRQVRDLVWARADTLIWLNYSFPLVFGRALRRTLVRSFTRKRIYHDNQESFRRSFLTRESILLWVIQTHGNRRRLFPEEIGQPEYAHLNVIEFQTPRDCERFLADHAA
jgi:adenylate kinase family enzyme